MNKSVANIKDREMSATQSHVFVEDMPAKERHELCKLLDQNDTWQELAKYMNYNPGDIQVK